MDAAPRRRGSGGGEGGATVKAAPAKSKSKPKATTAAAGKRAGPQARELMPIRIVGGGLAGSRSRVAGGIARRAGHAATRCGRSVPTAVHKTDRLAELVCSNSFRGDKLDNAVGLLKEEMRRLGSLVMRAAEASRVPAGAALAVDRERFADVDHARARRRIR